MKKEVLNLLKDKQGVTDRVNNWIGVYTKTEIANILNISRPTLNQRLQTNEWKYKEVEIICKNLPF